LKKLGIGCLGIVVLVIVVVVLVTATGGGKGGSQTSTDGAQASAHAAMGKIGETETTGDWAITLDSVDTAKSLGSDITKKDAQGEFVVVAVTAKNVSKQTTVLNGSDFIMKTADGTTFDSSSDGETAVMGQNPPPLILLEQIQPGLSKQYRVVFDVNPTTKQYTLTAAKSQFAVSLP